jgi:hypothetical protein
MNEPLLAKMSFGFTVEDMAVLQKVRELLRVKHGEVSNVVAIRTALREYVASSDRGEK